MWVREESGKPWGQQTVPGGQGSPEYSAGPVASTEHTQKSTCVCECWDCALDEAGVTCVSMSLSAVI